MEWLAYLGKVLYLALPVVLAGTLHMAVVALDIAPWLKRPLDGGATLRGRRLLGENKTLRGLIAMPLFAAIFFVLQAWLYGRSAWAREASFFDYTLAGSVFTPFTAGLVYGLGYALAELPNSFVKRQLGVAAGREAGGRSRWIFLLVDQGDSAVGCVLALCLFWTPPWHVALSIVGIGTGLHLAMNALLYLAGLRKRPV